MDNKSETDIQRFAGSVGCLIDRALSKEEVLGTVWLVDDNKAVTCGHLAVLYDQYLAALAVRFPTTRQERGISEVKFHPKFNRKQVCQMAEKALVSPVPALPLQEHNLVVLTLSPQLTPFLEKTAAQQLNEGLSLPVPVVEHGLSGSLAELSLPDVVQTVCNARKQGNLILLDVRNRPLARVFVKDGKIIHARYGNRAKMGMYQLVGTDIFRQVLFSSS